MSALNRYLEEAERIDGIVQKGDIVRLMEAHAAAAVARVEKERDALRGVLRRVYADRDIQRAAPVDLLDDIYAATKETP
jgi:hypothetical protein